MPLVYADTSALFAFFYPDDEFSEAVDAAAHRDLPDFVYWEYLRYELRHNLRLTRAHPYGETAWRALRAAEKTAARLRWQGEITVARMLDSAEELSAEKAGDFDCGSSDYLHVAVARRVNLLSGLDEFWTCDAAQAALAQSVGLRTRLFEIKSRG